MRGPAGGRWSSSPGRGALRVCVLTAQCVSHQPGRASLRSQTQTGLLPGDTLGKSGSEPGEAGGTCYRHR